MEKRVGPNTWEKRPDRSGWYWFWDDWNWMYEWKKEPRLGYYEVDEDGEIWHWTRGNPITGHEERAFVCEPGCSGESYWFYGPIEVEKPHNLPKPNIEILKGLINDMYKFIRLELALSRRADLEKVGKYKKQIKRLEQKVAELESKSQSK